MLKVNDRVSTWNGSSKGIIIEICKVGAWVRFDAGVVVLCSLDSLYKIR